MFCVLGSGLGNCVKAWEGGVECEVFGKVDASDFTLSSEFVVELGCCFGWG